ncbi:hypothetical protein Athai_61140 [Actinocatenispora thailandica]|uniref:DUF2255 domain-containing protein n=1 Tax=Actinocatenispora thailandica TaxID=227318 RepID=A0A7R7DVK0_9ACTN|nr:DUF2255 family protein [Actinocatenispora thailandica]BCJ38611.1 hypothetical protein Athai_61140 [Actinocatenispora thailandica]
MTTTPDIEQFRSADEIEISTRRSDGSLRSFVPIWLVSVDGALYIRSYRGTAGAWYRHAIAGGSRHTGAIRAGGHQANVTFTQVGPGEHGLLDAISQAYQNKYARYGDTYLKPMLAERATAATVRLDPAGDQ